MMVTLLGFHVVCLFIVGGWGKALHSGKDFVRLSRGVLVYCGWMW